MRKGSNPPGHVREGLGPLIASGLAWKGGSQVLQQVTRLVVALALARILAPHNYGIAAMVLVFAGFVLIFSDLALGQALVQRRALTQRDCSTAFWTSIGAGAAFMLAGVGLAGPVAAFFGEPVLRPMIAVLSVSFLISAIGTTQSALLVRSMRFRSLQLRELAATFVGAAVAISVAVGGGGAWAVVAQQLTAGAASTVLVWRFSSWRPDVSYSLASLRSLAGFSANVLGVNILAQLRTTTQSVLIGRFLGAPALGAYVLAYNVVLVPFNRVAVPLAQVLFPALSSVQDDVERIRGYWLRSLRMIAALSLPATLGLVVIAPDFVRSVLGEEWSKSVPVIQLLAVVGFIQTLQFLNPIILQALDRTTLLFVWSLVSTVATVIALLVGLRWGIVGVAAALAVAAGVTEPVYALLTARAARLRPTMLLRALSGTVQAALVMAICLTLGRLLLVNEGVPAAARLAILIPVGASVFFAMAAWRDPELFRDLRRLRGAVRPRPHAGPQPSET